MASTIYFLPFFILTFSSFFPLIDPFGLVPIFASVTEGLSPVLSRRLALRACIYAFMLILLCGLFGPFVFDYFHITTDSLKIVGGIIFFLMGKDMLQANISRMKTDQKGPLDHIHLSGTDLSLENKELLDDYGLTPFAIPLICGPGAITNAILLVEKSRYSPIPLMAFALGTLAMMIITYICLLSAHQIKRLIGSRGIKVIVRIMGLLLMVLAVEFFFEGLGPMIKKMQL
jgi:multiple antibiotic resistance protein